MSTNTNSLGAKSNFYYYRDQYSFHNTDALQSEHEQYITSCTTQQSKSPKNSHTTFHIPKKSNHLANTLSTLHPSEFEAKVDKNLTKNYSNSTKSLSKNKFYSEDDYKADNVYCDDDILTSHYYHNNKTKAERKGKKSKR